MAAANLNSLPEGLQSQLQNAAEEEHRSADEVLADAVKLYVAQRSWATLLEYGQEQTRTMGIHESDIDRLIAEYRVEKRSR